jgi:hypothetical protein
MRRAGIALIVLATLVAAAASGGSSAFALDPGPVSASPNAVQFGVEAAGVTTPEQIVTISDDSSTVPLQITSVNASGAFNVPSGTDNCTGTTLSAGDTCTVSVTFQPNSAGPVTQGELTVTDDDTTDGVTSQQVADLTAADAVATQFSLGGPIDFGSQPVGSTSGSKAELVTNNTDYSGNPPTFGLSGGNANDFALDASGCAGTVTTNGCSVNVTFSPNNTGSRSTTLNMGSQSVVLSGTGTQANAGVSPGSIAFGSQPTASASAPVNITLTNNGTAPLTYGGVARGGTNPGDFSVSGSNCSGVGSLQPGDFCTISVQFVPTTTGNRSATVIVSDGDPQHPTQTVSVTGKGTPSSIGFGPGTVTFTKAIPAGTPSPVHVVKITNMTSSTMPITSIGLAGANPQSFIQSADTCSGTTLAASGSCTVHVEFAPTAAGLRTALLTVADTGSVGSTHSHQLTLTGTATFPNDPKSIRRTVGCASTHISWISPRATRFATTVVVRNHARYPKNPGDGTIVRHTTAVTAVDKGLKHFSTYYYRVFARYHSLTRPTQVNYSAGVRFRLATGEICTPQNGARLRDLRPTLSWLAHSTQNGYAFVLEHGGDPIMTKYSKKTSWRFPASWNDDGHIHRLVRHRGYTLFLFAYPKAHPKGILIGQVSFSEL